MKLNSFIFSVVLLIISGLIYQSCISEMSANPQPSFHEVKQWTTLKYAISQSKKDNKKIMIDVYTDWCKWCKVMDEKTFNNNKIKSFLEDNYHLVKFNAEQKEVINFNGKPYKYIANGRRGNHTLASELLDGQLSYPSLVVLDPSLNKIQTIRGYKTPEQLIEILNVK